MFSAHLYYNRKRSKDKNINTCILLGVRLGNVAPYILAALYWNTLTLRMFSKKKSDDAPSYYCIS